MRAACGMGQGRGSCLLGSRGAVLAPGLPIHLLPLLLLLNGGEPMHVRFPELWRQGVHLQGLSRLVWKLRGLYVRLLLLLLQSLLHHGVLLSPGSPVLLQVSMPGHSPDSILRCSCLPDLLQSPALLSQSGCRPPTHSAHASRIGSPEWMSIAAWALPLLVEGDGKVLLLLRDAPHLLGQVPHVWSTYIRMLSACRRRRRWLAWHQGAFQLGCCCDQAPLQHSGAHAVCTPPQEMQGLVLGICHPACALLLASIAMPGPS